MTECLISALSPFYSPVYVHNPHLDALKDDILYHFSLGTGSHNLAAMFGDVKVKNFNTFFTGKSVTHMT